MTSKFQPLAGALLLACAFLFTSCGGDDEETELINVSNLTAATAWTFDSVEDAADANSSIGLSFFAPTSLSFSEDNTFTGANLTEEFEGTWSFSNNMLTFEDEEDPVSFEVRELTADRMVLYMNDMVFDPNTEQEFLLQGSLVYVNGN